MGRVSLFNIDKKYKFFKSIYESWSCDDKLDTTKLAEFLCQLPSKELKKIIPVIYFNQAKKRSNDRE